MAVNAAVPVPSRVLVVLAAAVIVLGAVAIVTVQPGGPRSTTLIDNLWQVAAASAATACCAWRGLHHTGRWRRSWFLMAVGTGSWAVGQVGWTWFEHVRADGIPFPSVADVGFLLFPVLALAGLLVRPSAAFGGRGRLRVVLDGTMVAASLFNLTWTTSLGQVYAAGADSDLAFGVGLAYPISDLILLTVAVLVVVQARMRSGLTVLAAGLAAMAIADSAFLYLTASGSYSTGAALDVGWVTAFVLIACSALVSDGAEASEGESRATGSAVYVVLPYLLVAVGIFVTIVSVARDSGTRVTGLVATIAVMALLVRQFLTLLDNRRLVDDVAARQDELRRQAFHDDLTGLANRALFNDRVGHAMALHRRELRPVAVLFCDLDDFKTVNDTLGHAAGDALLVAVAERLRAIMRPGDTIARLGGDEFGILLEGDNDAMALAGRLLDALTVPVVIGERDIPVRISIGVATLAAEEITVSGQELVRRADIAMYAAKRSGKATVVPYSPVIGSRADHDLDLRLALTRDILDGDLGTVCQQIVFADGSLMGFEALARWTYRGEPVPPDTFIPVADRAGMLRDLDMLTMRRAIQTAAGLPTTTLVAVNIGLSHLTDARLVDRIAGLLAQHQVPASRLVVEIPEHEAIGDARVLSTLAGLRRLGVRIAMDDFGVGHSGLSRIQLIHPAIIKIDRLFVARMSDPASSHELMGGIIDLAHRLGAVVVAEGVETQGQLDALVELGCDAVQGFLHGQPTPIGTGWLSSPSLEPAGTSTTPRGRHC